MNLLALLIAATGTSSTTTIAVDLGRVTIPAPPPAVTPTARFAVVIGVNQPLPGSDYDTLKYADDDALRFTEFFDSIGVDTTLLTAPDRETADRYAALADRARRPTRGQLDQALDQIEAKLEAAEGQTRELYFVFSGHGSISSTLAYLHLFDGRLTRTDLYEQILKRMPVERIHVIIDSCHSYFLVNARGKRVAVAEDEEDLDRYPEAGFLLSTSGNREVQEWSGYQAGVFSYQVLGALRGAADVDGDGTVSYDEVHGYVVAANLDVTREDARIQPYVRKPTTRGRSLVDLRAAPDAPRAFVPPEIGGHFFVADNAGVRLLDAHKPVGSDLFLILPERQRFFVYFGPAVYEITAGRLARLQEEAMVVAANKGTVADEFRTNLFKTPLTEDFVRGMSAASPQVTHVTRRSGAVWYQDPVTLSLLGAGGASLVVGAFATLAFTNARDDANQRPVTVETEAARQRALDWRAVMIATYAAGGALLTAGLLKAIFTDGDETFAFVITGPSAAIAGRF